MKSTFCGNAKENIFSILRDYKHFFNQSFYKFFIREMKKQTFNYGAVKQITCLILIETENGKIYVEPHPSLENSTVACCRTNSEVFDSFCFVHKE